MNKQAVLKVLNPALFIVLCVQAATGIIMGIELKVPFIAQLYELHAYNGYFLTALVIAHIALNWAWVKNVIFKK